MCVSHSRKDSTDEDQSVTPRLFRVDDLHHLRPLSGLGRTGRAIPTLPGRDISNAGATPAPPERPRRG